MPFGATERARSPLRCSTSAGRVLSALAMNNVLLIGLLPSVVDLSSVPGLTEEKLAVTLKTEEQRLREIGFDATWCLIDTGATAESVVRTALEARAYDVVLVGAGVRTIPTYFLLFEKLVNLIHQHAHDAKICFNTRPDDTVEAVLRWLAPPAKAR